MDGVSQALPLGSDLAPLIAAFFAGIGSAAQAFHKQPVLGALFALASLVFILVVLAIQNRNTTKYVRQYRHYEIALIIRNRLSVHRLVDYHRGIAWRDFAAISTSSGIAGAALMFSGGASGGLSLLGGANAQGTALTQDAAIILFVSIGFQVASAIVMMMCDFVHTNTISPLVPPLRRLQIVGDAIVLGGGAMIFNIAALISFMSIFSPWISVFCSLLFVFVTWRLTALRSIEVDELLKWLRMERDGEWAEIDAAVRLTGKKQRDLLFRKFYDEYWSRDHEDPRTTP
ncbi:MAG TPA: hypothetical protein VG735_01275 [Caulobacterales bacterium]|nr:hypothetical protein [Caulobacterales bacterium]